MRLPDWVLQDREYLAALWLLSTPALATKKVLRHVHLGGDTFGSGIDFPTLIEESGPWSHGQQILIRVAHVLFNGGDAPGDTELLQDALSTLDDGNLLRVLEAIFIRRPGLAAFFEVDVSPARIAANISDD